MIPDNLVLEFTNHCNLSCEMCPRNYINSWQLGYIDFLDFAHIVEQVSDKIDTLITAWRGESTLHPQFNLLSCYARQYFKTMILITNGIFPNRSDIGLREYDLINLSWHKQTPILSALKLLKRNGCKIVVSWTDSEPHSKELEQEVKHLADETRIYTTHTENGKWGSTNTKSAASMTPKCRRLKKQLVISWDLKLSRCCYYYPTELLKLRNNILKEWQEWYNRFIEGYPDQICLNCNQQEGVTQ